MTAARMAGYDCPHPEGARLLQNATVKAAIATGLSAALKPDQIVARLSEFAESDTGDFLTVDPTTGKAEVDLAKAMRLGKTHLIKRVVPTKYGTTVELHDQVASLKLLGQYQGMWIDRQEQEITVNAESARAELAAKVQRLAQDLRAKAQATLPAPVAGANGADG